MEACCGGAMTQMAIKGTRRVGRAAGVAHGELGLRRRGDGVIPYMARSPLLQLVMNVCVSPVPHLPFGFVQQPSQSEHQPGAPRICITEAMIPSDGASECAGQTPRRA